MAIVGKILLGLLLTVFGLLILIVLLLLIALLIPASVELHYAPGDFRVRLRVLWYVRQLLPEPPPKPKKKKIRVPKAKRKAAVRKKKPLTADRTAPPKPAGRPEKRPEKTVQAQSEEGPKDRPPKRTSERPPEQPVVQLPEQPVVQLPEQPVGPPSEQPVGQLPVREQAKTSETPPPKADAQPQPPPQGPKAESAEKYGTAEKAEKSDTSETGKKDDTEGKEKTDRLEKIKNTLGKLPTMVGQAGAFMGAVLRSLRFVHIRLILPVHERLPDRTARAVGRTNAWLYGIASQLEPRLHLKWDEVRVVPDYDDQFADRLLLEMTVRGSLLPVILAALRVYRVLKQEEIL